MMKTQKNWEYYFQDAILSVEEQLSKSGVQTPHKSKLRIALENNFVTWYEYKEWCKDHYGFPVLHVEDPKYITHLQKIYQRSRDLFIAPDIWSDDLIALDQWDDQLIVLGLEPNESLKKIQNFIFILCSHDILKLIINNPETSLIQGVQQNTAETHSEFDEVLIQPLSIDALIPDLTVAQDLEITQNKNHINSLESFNANESVEVVAGPLDLLEIHNSVEIEEIVEITEHGEDLISSPGDLSDKSIFAGDKDAQTNLNERIWNNLAEHHDSYASKVRKQFDAYLVLRVTPEQTTEVYRMDEDLAKEDINFNVFKYDLKSPNPFQNVYQNHFTETFNVNQLGLKILDFKYACVSVLKLGKKVVGFIVGFKTTHLSQEDISTLESISEKVV